MGLSNKQPAYIVKMHAYMKLRNLSARTIEMYLYAMLLFVEAIKKHPSKATFKDIQDYCLYMRDTKQYSMSTYKIYLAAIRYFYKHICPKTWVDTSIPYPKAEKHVPVILSRNEVERLLSCIDNPIVKMIAIIAYACGLRHIEVRHLKYSDIDRERMKLIIRNAKGRKSREVTLPASVLKRLSLYFRAHRGKIKDYLFYGIKENRIIDETAVLKAIKRATRKAKIKKAVILHTLRHCYATHALEDGCNIKRLQKELGHSSLNTTFKYIQYIEEKNDYYQSPFDTLLDEMIARMKKQEKDDE